MDLGRSLRECRFFILKNHPLNRRREPYTTGHESVALPLGVDGEWRL